MLTFAFDAAVAETVPRLLRRDTAAVGPHAADVAGNPLAGRYWRRLLLQPENRRENIIYLKRPAPRQQDSDNVNASAVCSTMSHRRMPNV